MPDYKDRLKRAMLEAPGAPVTTQQLADKLGVSYQAVKKVLDGKSSAFDARNNAKAAEFLGVRSDWLAIGEGPMRVTPVYGTGSASFGVTATGTAEAMPATPPAGTIDHAYGSYTRILRFADFIKHLDDDDREVLALRFASLIRKPEQAERYAVEIERLLGGVGKSQAGASMSSDSKSASAKS